MDKMLYLEWRHSQKEASHNFLENAFCSYENGDMGIRSLIKFNEAFNLLLCWNLVCSEDSWAELLRSRVLKGKQTIRYHIYSSIWNITK